jgi:hypothetical protein
MKTTLIPWMICIALLFVQRMSSPGTPAVFIEAEDFEPGNSEWQALKAGDNYYHATFANTFLSRKAFLGAPEQCDRAVAAHEVHVPAPGRYLALVRYEAVYRFETQFRLRIEQNGRTLLDRLYGARENLKIWAFGNKLTNEVSWDWGASENIVWEGHDAFVDLEEGRARVMLIAERQPEPAARRNIDLVMLTGDHADVRRRIDKEAYLPLDGLLTQAGDLFLKLHVSEASSPVTVQIPNGVEHSPYWVHLREWQPKQVKAAAGQSSDWVEVGSLLDSLNDGQWHLSAKGEGPLRFSLEFGVPSGNGIIETIRRFDELTGGVTLAYDADTRRSRRIRSTDEVLYDLVDFLKQRPVRGKRPKQTLIYGYTFPPRPEDPKYTAALSEFVEMIGATALGSGRVEELPDAGLVRGYVDVRDLSLEQLEKFCAKLKAEGKAEKIAVVSLGDEITLRMPSRNIDGEFRAWLQGQGIRPSDLLEEGEDWERISYQPGRENAREHPAVFYYSNLFRYRYGIRAQKAFTDILRRELPNAGIGANFSPHHGTFYLGETYQWISLFREDGMTMPWSEDYIFQVPVGTPQMNFLLLDLFRAGLKGRPDRKIHFYVMPHWPGTTPAMWRRQFYGDVAHGAKVFNLFEFRPVQAAYTENHVSLPEMYQEVRRAFHELGLFEEIIQDGQVRPGEAALWFSETGDIWNNNRLPFEMGKRTLCIAIRHQQVPMDVVVEGDALAAYKILFLADQNVSQAAARSIAEWVRRGGRLFATAGAGMFDEFNRPNTVLRELFGVEQTALEEKQALRFEKQDLPFAEPIEQVTWNRRSFPVFGAVSHVEARSGKVLGRFADGSPAITLRAAGKGRALYCGFLPGLSYFKPALPLRPVDRGSRDDAYCHFIPTEFDPAISELMGLLIDFEKPVVCSEPLVATTMIDSRYGTLIPLNNWSAGPVRGLEVEIRVPVPLDDVSLASGNPLKQRRGKNGQAIFTLDLDIADALILR